MAELIAPIALIVVQIVGFAVMLGFLRSRNSSLYRRANFEIRSWSGRNASMVLSTLAVAKLLADTPLIATSRPHPLVLPIALAVVMALLMLRRFGPPLVSLVGLTAFWADAFVIGDAESGLWFIVVSIFMLIVLGLLRPLLST